MPQSHQPAQSSTFRQSRFRVDDGPDVLSNCPAGHGSAARTLRLRRCARARSQIAQRRHARRRRRFNLSILRQRGRTSGSSECRRRIASLRMERLQCRLMPLCSSSPPRKALPGGPRDCVLHASISSTPNRIRKSLRSSRSLSRKKFSPEPAIHVRTLSIAVRKAFTSAPSALRTGAVRAEFSFSITSILTFWDAGKSIADPRNWPTISGGTSDMTR